MGHLCICFVVAEEIAEVPFTPGHEMVGQVSLYISLVPRPSLDLPWQLLMSLFECNIKSWEIEREPGDEATYTSY